ncbi:endonuclease III [Arcanobacterium pinnipediorum]|uniref:Endonuclease III n=1 Tax=Arcanobacterium pinnipediorum TaxID=1503041 RepID=A0ABY5AJA1_9ACTO|nr:endonuclease III [Arcanobacterium pinnipediorum]USR79319.1 endonuclease III [Arcanobacterium pinnipediorum]
MNEKKSVRRRLPFRPRSLTARRQQADRIVQRLAELYPDSHCALDHRNPFELLTATVLSAQTTDARVNSVTPTLFDNFPNAHALAQAPLAVLEEILHPLGFYRAKARSLNGLATGLIDRFDGNVPPNLQDLVTLPGVGRKTANVVLGNAFDIPGITVDTHVGRLARRWAWTRETDPVKAEADLAKILPQSQWTIICHRVIDHGRQVCHSRKPACGSCPMADICPSFELEIG